MKKNIFITSVIVIMVLVFLGIQLVGERQVKNAKNHRTELPYYKERIAVEDNALESAIADSGKIVTIIKQSRSCPDEQKQMIKGCLLYCKENFSELKKGDDANLEVVGNLIYSIAMPYYMVLQSDADETKETKLEQNLRQTTLFQYTRDAFRYAEECNSLTQDEEYYNNAEKLDKILFQDIEKEIDEFLTTVEMVVLESE